MDNLIPVLVGLPLAGAAVLLLGGRRLDRFGHWLGVLASTASFGVGLALFFDNDFKLGLVERRDKPSRQ